MIARLDALGQGLLAGGDINAEALARAIHAAAAAAPGCTPSEQVALADALCRLEHAVTARRDDADARLAHIAAGRRGIGGYGALRSMHTGQALSKKI